MRISDWSSDVCSSDLPGRDAPVAGDLRGSVTREKRGAVWRLVGVARIVEVELAITLVRIAFIDDRSVETFGQRRCAADMCGDQHQRVGRDQFRLRQIRRLASRRRGHARRSEEHTSELQSLMRNSYA